MRLRHHGDVIYERAAGYARRANRIPSTLEDPLRNLRSVCDRVRAGVSFWSSCRPSEGLEFSVLSNTTDGLSPSSTRSEHLPRGDGLRHVPEMPLTVALVNSPDGYLRADVYRYVTRAVGFLEQAPREVA